MRPEGRPGRVFLSDAQQRKTLAFARVFGKGGMEVAVGEETRAAVTMYSRYVKERFIYPAPKKKPLECKRELLRFIGDYKPDVFFPVDDPITDIVSASWDEFARLSPVALCPPECYQLARSKELMYALAKERGVRAPVTHLPENVADAVIAARDIGFPVVLKPRKGSGARGLLVVNSEAQLEQVMPQLEADFGRLMVQEYIPQGRKFDVCMLYDGESRPRLTFTQEELRTYPAVHGSSTLQESVERPDLVELAKRLLCDTGWRSIAEVEFMEDPRTGEAVLMEVNPRLWASVKCALLSGVDFATGSYLEALGEEVPEQHVYRTGVRCRWLLPGDILRFVFGEDRFSMEPSFFSMDHRTFFDIYEPGDIGPVFGVFSAVARYMFDRDMWRLVVR